MLKMTCLIDTRRVARHARGALAGAVLALLLLSAPATAGAPKLDRIGETVLLGADKRFSFDLPKAMGYYRVRDTRTHQSYVVRTPCAFLASRLGLALFRCSGSPQEYRVLRISTRVETSTHSSEANDHFDLLGKYWLAGSNCPSPSNCTAVYLNWRTGERRSFGEPPEPVPNHNIDSPSLDPGSPPQSAPEFPQREGGATLSLGGPDGNDLILRANGRKRTLSTCELGECLAPRLLAGVVTWSHTGGTGAYAYDIDRDRTIKWRFEPIPTAIDANVRIQHTKYEVLISVAARLDSAGNAVYRLYAAPLP